MNGEYFSGTKVMGDRKRITGFINIKSPENFSETKKSQIFVNWLQLNKVWVRHTVLSSNRQIKLVWILYSILTYTNFAWAEMDLVATVGNPEQEVKLSLLSIVHHFKR